MDPEIWKLALMVIARHGTEAGDFAADRAKLALEECDERRYQLWAWIKLLVDEFLKETPDDDDSVH